MNIDKMKEGITRYGTPMYLFDLDILKEEVKRFRECLGEKIKLCYAMKANPFITKQMEEEMDRIEICSMGEFLICKSIQINPEKMLISGVMKKKEDLKEIVKYCGDQSRYTVESLNQFQDLVDISKEYNLNLGVFLRLSSGNQFGMDEATIMNLFAKRDLSPSIRIEGIHYFSGTQKKSVEVIQKELHNLDLFLEKIKTEYDVEIHQLEYGPGVAVPYFVGREEDSFTNSGLQRINQMIHEMKWQGQTTLEMGRALSAMCGYYATQVKDIKSTDQTNYCIVDGGNHQMNYDGQIRGMYQPIVHVISESVDEQESLWTICGSLCTSNDVLCKNIRLQNLKVGDVLIFERTGAYSMTEGMALFLSHDLPKITLYSEKDKWNLVRNGIPTYKLNMSKEDL